MHSAVLATQLAGVVQDTVGDVEGLHSKLDRRRNVDRHNETATEKFQQVCVSQIVCCVVYNTYVCGGGGVLNFNILCICIILLYTTVLYLHVLYTYICTYIHSWVGSILYDVINEEYSWHIQQISVGTISSARRTTRLARITPSTRLACPLSAPAPWILLLESMTMSDHIIHIPWLNGVYKIPFIVCALCQLIVHTKLRMYICKYVAHCIISQLYLLMYKCTFGHLPPPLSEQWLSLATSLFG